MRTTTVAEATETPQRADVTLQTIAMQRAGVGATLTRAQIVQQAGQAMLAQANTNARLILALLRSDR